MRRETNQERGTETGRRHGVQPVREALSEREGEVMYLLSQVSQEEASARRAGIRVRGVFTGPGAASVATAGGEC